MNEIFEFSGLGNKILILDLLKQDIEVNPKLIRKLKSLRNFDQLLTIEPPTKPNLDLSTKIYNSDTSEAENCVNGARCLARYVIDNEILGKKEFKVSTISDIWSLGEIDRNNYFVCMEGPDFSKNSEHLPLANEAGIRKLEFDDLPPLEVSFVNIGNPHCVNFTEDINSGLLNEWGAQLQNSPYFPEGVNLSLAKIISKDCLSLRVYERGAGETEACGSAACASVVLGYKLDLIGKNTNVSFNSGELRVNFDEISNIITLQGGADFIGKFEFDS